MVPLKLDDSHLADIKMITSMLSDAGLRGRLRDASTSNDLYESLQHGGNLSAPAQAVNAQGN
jgi:hypothetical protein